MALRAGQDLPYAVGDARQVTGRGRPLMQVVFGQDDRPGLGEGVTGGPPGRILVDPLNFHVRDLGCLF